MAQWGLQGPGSSEKCWVLQQRDEWKMGHWLVSLEDPDLTSSHLLVVGVTGSPIRSQQRRDAGRRAPNKPSPCYDSRVTLTAL